MAHNITIAPKFWMEGGELLIGLETRDECECVMILIPH